MDFLDWVRGPLLTLSLFIFVAGVAWRLLALWRLPHRVAPGAPERQPFGTGAALGWAVPEA